MGDRNFQADDRCAINALIPCQPLSPACMRFCHTCCINRRPPVRFLDDEELAYVAQRSREIHDFWHVLFGCHTNVFGELALKAVEFVQARLWFLPYQNMSTVPI